MTGADGSPDRAAVYRAWQIKILSGTWLAYFGYYFCRKAFFVVKDDLGLAHGLDSVHLAHIGTAYLAGYAVGQFSSAFFGRKLGPKLLLLVGMGISIGCNVAFGAINSFWTILLFMAINGMAQGTGWPGCIGSLAATSFAAFMLGWLGWRSSFFGASVVLLVIWAIVLWLHPNTPEDVGLESVK